MEAPSPMVMEILVESPMVSSTARRVPEKEELPVMAKLPPFSWMDSPVKSPPVIVMVLVLLPMPAMASSSVLNALMPYWR